MSGFLTNCFFSFVFYWSSSNDVSSPDKTRDYKISLKFESQLSMSRPSPEQSLID